MWRHGIVNSFKFLSAGLHDSLPRRFAVIQPAFFVGVLTLKLLKSLCLNNILISSPITSPSHGVNSTHRTKVLRLDYSLVKTNLPTNLHSLHCLHACQSGVLCRLQKPAHAVGEPFPSRHHKQNPFRPAAGQEHWAGHFPATGSAVHAGSCPRARQGGKLSCNCIVRK